MQYNFCAYTAMAVKLQISYKKGVEGGGCWSQSLTILAAIRFVRNVLQHRVFPFPPSMYYAYRQLLLLLQLSLF
jgi:hypothetical protein